MQSSPPLERLSKLITTVDSAREEIDKSGPGLNRLISDALRIDSADGIVKEFERIRSDAKEKYLHIRRLNIKDQIPIVEAFLQNSHGQNIPYILALKANKEKSKIFPKKFKKDGTIDLFFEEFKQIVEGLLLEIKDGKEDKRLLLSPEELIYDKLFDYAKAKYANYPETEEKPISSEMGTDSSPISSAKTWKVVKEPISKAKKYYQVRYMSVKPETEQELKSKKIIKE